MQSINNKNGLVAIYLRLSSDDGRDGESNSITNQRAMLEKYVTDKKLGQTKVYIDDGYTGTNFNRPGFLQMKEDIELGYIHTVIVKDLSRLGRDYVNVGFYTDTFFPNNDVRFIAVNDLVDSFEGENEIAPFKNVMNEMYAKDTSRKVRSAHRIRGSLGEPLAPPPYGYMKDPTNSKKWIIDPEVSPTIKKIFQYCIEGKGVETTAKLLQEQNILTPLEYWKSKGIGRGGAKTSGNPYKWSKGTIAKILTLQEYTGDLVNFKTYSKSYKDKRRRKNPVENWKIFEDNHEAIIDRETFNMVQDIRQKTKRRAPKKENSEKSMFSNLLYCADCGSKLWSHTNTVNKDIHYFSCSNYIKDTRGTCETRHYIREDAVEQIVMLELKHLGRFAMEDRERFIEVLAEKSNKDIKTQQKLLETTLEKSIARSDNLATLYERLYEDNVSGKVTDEWFMQLSRKYETERVELKLKIARMQEELKNIGEKQKAKELFGTAIDKFMQMKTLTVPLLRELIERIDVYETQGVGKSRTQHIVIHYRFVGYIVLPEIPQKSNYKQDMRQGVAIEYIPKAITA